MHPTETPDTISHQPDRAHRLSMEHLLAYVPRSAARVLDCTATPGHRGALLKEHGAREVVGLLDTAASDPAGAGYDQVIQEALDRLSLPFPPGQFDCIICTETLERRRNPEAFLTPLLDSLTPGGLFLATVPNIQYHKVVRALVRGRWHYGNSGVWDQANLRFFTAREIKVLLGDAGVETSKLASLVKDAEEAFPRDNDGYVRRDGLRIGPLDTAAWQAWLTEYYLVLAVKPAL